MNITPLSFTLLLGSSILLLLFASKMMKGFLKYPAPWVMLLYLLAVFLGAVNFVLFYAYEKILFTTSIKDAVVSLIVLTVVTIVVFVYLSVWLSKTRQSMIDKAAVVFLPVVVISFFLSVAVPLSNQIYGVAKHTNFDEVTTRSSELSLQTADGTLLVRAYKVSLYGNIDVDRLARVADEIGAQIRFTMDVYGDTGNIDLNNIMLADFTVWVDQDHQQQFQQIFSSGERPSLPWFSTESA